MSLYTSADLVVAVKAANAAEFPLVADIEMARVFADAVQPALEDMPPHLNCEVVKLALETLFVMGIAAGLELERRR